MRSTQPINSPHTPSMPVSSRSSRTHASANVSPNSTRPPGRLHRPRPGCVPRCTSNSRPADTVTAPTQSWGRSLIVFECPVYVDRSRDEAKSFEEVLAFTVARQHHRINSGGMLLSRPCEHQLEERFADADAACFGLDEYVVHAHDARVVEVARRGVRISERNVTVETEREQHVGVHQLSVVDHRSRIE